MRICVVSHRDPTRDPTTRVLITSLRAAGNEVSVVTDAASPTDPRRLRRPVGTWRWRAAGEQAPSAAVAATLPDIVYPATADDLDLAAAMDAAIARRVDWPDPGPRDLIRLAPHDTRLSSSPAGPPAPFHQPGDDRSPWQPAAGRHHGTTVAVAARFTTTNPSRYLVAALQRAGVTVIMLDGVIDADRIPPRAAAVVVVESPLPALTVRGLPQGVPVLYWVHHGEHHLMANLRLAHRYQADAVLLAHSWHLAHRFAVPVHRFPFAVAPEVVTPGPAFADRALDVAMVGAGLDDRSGRYDRRQTMAAGLAAALPGRTGFRSGMSPEAMAGLYGRVRIVVNDGGTRHRPITMRVFEALGAGALLLTEDLPGTDVLLRRHEHYVPLGDDPVGQVIALLADPGSEAIAREGQRHAEGRHTYDHRVDEMLAIAAATPPRRRTAASPPADALAAAVDADVEVHSVAVLGGVLDLPDRVVRTGDDAASRLAPGKTDAVVIGPDGYPDLDVALRAARRYVYAAAPVAAAVRGRLAVVHPTAVLSDLGGVLRADLGAPGYRVAPTPTVAEVPR